MEVQYSQEQYIFNVHVHVVHSMNGRTARITHILCWLTAVTCTTVVIYVAARTFQKKAGSVPIVDAGGRNSKKSSICLGVNVVSPLTRLPFGTAHTYVRTYVCAGYQSISRGSGGCGHKKRGWGGSCLFSRRLGLPCFAVDSIGIIHIRVQYTKTRDRWCWFWFTADGSWSVSQSVSPPPEKK